MTQVNEVRKLEEKTEIRTTTQVVWEAMADFGNASTWAPGMRKSSLKGDKKTGVGTHRIMRHSWGFRIEEIVTEWTTGTGYSFKLVKAPFPMCEVCETWVLRPAESGALLTIVVTYGMRLGLLGNLLDTVLVRFVVAREMRLSIRGLKRHLEEMFVAP